MDLAHRLYSLLILALDGQYYSHCYKPVKKREKKTEGELTEPLAQGHKNVAC